MARMTVEQYIAWYKEHYGSKPPEKLIESFCKENRISVQIKEEQKAELTKAIVFECSENQNEHKEEFEFNADATDEEIEEEFKEWVWNEIGDHYNWHEKEEGEAI